MKWTVGTLAGFLLILAAAPAMGGEPTTLIPIQDTTLYEALPVAGNGGGPPSNGAGDHFFTGTTALGDVRRGLLAFDLAGAIPAGSVITSVTLTLQMNRTIAGPTAVELHRVTSDWGEGDSDAPGEEGQGTPPSPGDATWIHTFYPGSFWASAGGDFASTVSAVQTVDDTGSYSWGSTPEMVADVQSWLDDSGTNFGWLILGDEASSATAKRFNSRENGTSEPQLTIEYQSPVPATPVWILVLLALTITALAIWHLRRHIPEASNCDNKTPG